MYAIKLKSGYYRGKHGQEHHSNNTRLHSTVRGAKQVQTFHKLLDSEIVEFVPCYHITWEGKLGQNLRPIDEIDGKYYFKTQSLAIANYIVQLKARVARLEELSIKLQFQEAA